MFFFICPEGLDLCEGCVMEADSPEEAVEEFHSGGTCHYQVYELRPPLKFRVEESRQFTVRALTQ